MRARGKKCWESKGQGGGGSHGATTPKPPADIQNGDGKAEGCEAHTLGQASGDKE